MERHCVNCLARGWKECDARRSIKTHDIPGPSKLTIRVGKNVMLVGALRHCFSCVVCVNIA